MPAELTIESERLTVQGYTHDKVDLPVEVRTMVRRRDWAALDRHMRVATQPGGYLFEYMQRYLAFASIEFIISLRTAGENEEGIWHDDGSRKLAFSLSLTENPHYTEGGILQIRPFGASPEQTAAIATPKFGEILVFLTGQAGFEHKIGEVTAGERLIIAGWCS